MSPSDALGPYPVICHFYPIDPEMASQQQAAVYNKPNFPLIAITYATPTASESLVKKPKKNNLSLNHQ